MFVYTIQHCDTYNKMIINTICHPKHNQRMTDSTECQALKTQINTPHFVTNLDSSESR